MTDFDRGGVPHEESAHSAQSVAANREHRSHSAAVGVQRDKNGRIERSQQAKNDFKLSHPCPSTGSSRGGCPGYVIDHVVPLKRGGADAPHNMQWQTVEQAKAKDKVE